MFLESDKQRIQSSFSHPARNHRGQRISRTPINFTNREGGSPEYKELGVPYVCKNRHPISAREQIRMGLHGQLQDLLFGRVGKGEDLVPYLSSIIFSWYFSKCGCIASNLSVLYHKGNVFPGSSTTVSTGPPKVCCQPRSRKRMGDNESQEEESV